MTRPTVLITGGSGGIGGALAQGLAARGYTPIIGFAGNTATAVPFFCWRKHCLMRPASSRW